MASPPPPPSPPPSPSSEALPLEGHTPSSKLARQQWEGSHGAIYEKKGGPLDDDKSLSLEERRKGALPAWWKGLERGRRCVIRTGPVQSWGQIGVSHSSPFQPS